MEFYGRLKRKKITILHLKIIYSFFFMLTNSDTRYLCHEIDISE